MRTFNTSFLIHLVQSIHHCQDLYAAQGVKHMRVMAGMCAKATYVPISTLSLSLYTSRELLCHSRADKTSQSLSSLVVVVHRAVLTNAVQSNPNIPHLNPFMSIGSLLSLHLAVLNRKCSVSQYSSSSLRCKHKDQPVSSA